MCDTCGCSDDNDIRMTNMQDGETVAVHRPEEDDGHEHGHSHGHHRETKTIRLEQQVLTKNDLLAERNRGWFIGRSILALNLVSSPGAGKTTLLERTIRDLAGR
ncbi:MAG: hydrogenase accessory protein HypB, partial [Armatimonadetes bacterium CG_4_8_14_3_um_filter_58_9]